MTTMKPFAASFEEVLYKLLRVPGFLLLPVEVEGPDIAKGLAEFLTAKGKHVAIVEPGSREIAGNDLTADIVAAAKDPSVDVVMVIGSENPAKSIHTGFRILNGARDHIVKKLKRPLLWCGPVSFLNMTWGEAPDFWSIRMLPVRIEAAPEADAPTPTLDESSSPEIREHQTNYEDAKQQTNPEITAYMARKFIEALLEAGELVRASAIVDEVVTRIRDNAPADALAEVELLSARVQRAHRDDMRAAATLGALISRPKVDAYLRIRAQLDLAKLFEDAGHLDSAERAYREALTSARSLSDIETEARALIGAYGIAARTGRIAEAEKPLEQAVAMARRLGNNALLASALAAQSLLALGSFDSAQGARKLDEARSALSHATRETTTVNPRDIATDPVDVLVLTALHDELDGVLAVGEQGNAWQELRDLGGFRYHRREIRRARDSFTVAAAWIGEMGGRAAAIRAQQLLTELDPSVLAMCGICAGDRNKVALGDIIVADRLFAWDEGKRITSPGKEDEFYHALQSFDLEKTWRMDAAFLAREIQRLDIARIRPPSSEAQTRWLLRAIETHESGKGSPPTERPELKRACPGYTTLVRKLFTDGLVARQGRTLVLTARGRDWVDEDVLLYPEGSPPDPPLRVHVGAMATVSAVIEDPGIFKRMQHVVRSTLGLDMEGSALGEVAQRFHKRAILVKAVQDFADGTKDDGFRAFGCGASAEFLFAFLEKHFEPEQDHRTHEKRGSVRELDHDEPREHPFLGRVERIVALRHPQAKIIRHRADEPFAGLLELDIDQGGFSETQLVAAIDNPIRSDLIVHFATSVERPFRDRHPLLRSTLVHQGDPAPRELRAEAFRKGIHLESFRAYQGLFDLGPYLEWQTNRLKQDPVYPPGMYVDAPATYEVSGSRELIRVDNVLRHLLDLLESSDQRRFALVIGEFGAGKTFLLHELARRMVVEKHPVWPVLVEMHHLEKQPDLPALLAAHFAKADVPGYNFKAFQYLLNEGRIALLFDGFDELAGQVSYDVVTAHFNTVLSAAQGERAKVVLSSRRQHFLSEAQIKDGVKASLQKLQLVTQAESIAGFRLVMLERFEELQIRQYLRNVLVDPQQADERYALIHEVKDLLGLSHNPRMLGFIAHIPETSLREAKQRDKEITAAKLYELLVKDWLEFEHQRSRRISTRQSISRKALDKGMTALALSMWQHGIKAVQVDQIRDVVAAAMRDLGESKLDPDVLTHMFGSGSLLVRDTDRVTEGHFTFVHRSVHEWFVAREAAKEVRDRGDSAPLAEDELSPLMADFFSAMAGREKAVAWARGKLLAREKGIVAKNATLVLQRLGESFEKLDLVGRDLRGQDFTGVDWRRADVRGADLEGATLVGANLEGANLEGARLYRGNLTNAKLAGAKLARADLRMARLLKADLTGAEGLDSTKLFRTNFAGAFISGRVKTAIVDPFGMPPNVRKADPMCAMVAPACRSVAFDKTGAILVAGFDDGSVRICDTTTGGLLRILAGHHGAVYSVAFSPNGTIIASGSNDKTLRLWDVASGRVLRSLEGHTSHINGVAFSPDGNTIASGSDDKTIYLWEVATGRMLPSFKGTPNAIWSVAFSPAGNTIACGSFAHAIRLWDVTSRQILRTLDGHSDGVRCVIFGCGTASNLIVSGSEDWTVRLWDATSGRELRLLKGHTKLVTGVALSPDGNTIASSSHDHTIRLWDAAIGRALRTLRGHQGKVTSVAFSPDGNTLASGSSDKTIRLWDVASGHCLRVIESDARWVRVKRWGTDGRYRESPTGWVAFTPDGRYKYGGNLEGAFWHVVGLCRFEVGEIDEFLPHLRMRDDEPIVLEDGSSPPEMRATK